MSDTLPRIRRFLEQSATRFEVIPCDPEYADTAAFCAHYGAALSNSANAILVKSKTGEEKFALCVLLATDRLDANRVVRKKLGARKLSFASAEETRRITGMEIGGVTPLALPDDLPIWIDSAVMDREYLLLGGGNRDSKLKVDPAVLIRQPAAEVVAGLARRDG